MKLTLNICLALFLTGSYSGNLFAADADRVLYKDAVAPILMAKCASCHGEKKQKGKLRLDSLESIMKGGSEEDTVVPGDVKKSSFVWRLHLPIDDDERMPPEKKEQLTKQELAVLEFWVKSGAKGDAKVSALKPDAATLASITHVFANPPKSEEVVAKAKGPALTPAQIKAGKETIAKIEKTGASLMAIAQDTPQLRFSALNVAKEYGDSNLALLKPVADQIQWVDLARTQVTDKGLAELAGMKNLNRLHLENTKITDAGLDQIKGLVNLEYLNLYGTAVTDAGIMKLAGLKKLKKLFLWQSKVSDEGAKKLAAAIPGIDINTGWKAAPVKPVVVAAATKKPATPAPPKPAPKKPAPKPAPKPVPAKPAPAKPAPATASSALQKALVELKLAAADATKKAAVAKTNADAANGKVAEATKVAAAAKAELAKADSVAKETKAALDQLLKVIEMTGKK